MPQTHALHEVARLPLPGDNVAVATRRLDAGTIIRTENQDYTLNATLLEGHRFALQPIAEGDPLLSWGLPFGVATRDIAPGNYVTNPSILKALSGRSIDFDLPAETNFQDNIQPYLLNESSFTPAAQVPRYEEDRTFKGYWRSEKRGVGTRNVIVLLGTTSRTGSFVKQLEERVKHLAIEYPNVDGIVAVAHTEGGSEGSPLGPNNLDLLLRTLAGFMVHPNVGAVLAVDYGVEPVTNKMLQAYIAEHDYPQNELPHAFLSLTGSFQANLEQADQQITAWLPTVNETKRTPQSLSHLKLALQCGGSDAFSGISGNPLAAWVAKEIIRYGGAANLAETDELIGAEPYTLQKVRSLETAQRFLAMIERFKERVAWHGHWAEGNPSGGNKFRGLYNIVLKSIGAAMKKHPDVSLDYAIDYSQPMQEPGYYFMDSPGNDLESIAGQVAAGCNLIYFVTGNGSITNFPFVPTIKIVTTSRRFRLLQSDMDVNAGAYLDGMPMDEVGAETLDLTVNVASGQRSVGEKAGHAQVQIWRDWRQTDTSNLEQQQTSAPASHSLPIYAPTSSTLPEISLPILRENGDWSLDQVGLILPTSLCAGQIAQMTAYRLNKREIGRDHHLSRFVSLVHTEGCGNSAGTSEELYIRTMLGYLRHPMVRHCLLLEHGCEKTHNDYMRNQMQLMGIDPEEVGWASIQLDGGINQVMDKIETWFRTQAEGSERPSEETATLAQLRLGLASSGPTTPAAATTFATIAAAVASTDGTVVMPQNAGLLSDEAFLHATLGEEPPVPSLAYGQPLTESGFHIMETPTAHWVETLTGLGATGVEVIVAYVTEHPLQTHPMIPLLQVTDNEQVLANYGADIDLALQGDADQWPAQILSKIADVAAKRYTPKLYQQGNVDFQITRGLFGVSM